MLPELLRSHQIIQQVYHHLHQHYVLIQQLHQILPLLQQVQQVLVHQQDYLQGYPAAFASNTITISGTPIASGTFNYSIPLTGGCGAVNATGTITVTPNNTAGVPSSSPTLCINTAIAPNITIATTGATGIGAPTGLPAGVSAAFASNTITISGTPTASGTFNYSIPLTGGCGAVNATGTITVKANNTAAAGGHKKRLCINTAIAPNITIATTGATGIGAPT